MGSAAAYIAAFGRPPFCWPGDVVRRQRMGDLNVHLQRGKADANEWL